MKTADMFIKRRRLIKRLLVLVLCVSAVYGALRIYWALWPGIQRARLTHQTMADVGSPSDYFPTVSGQPKETRVVTRLRWHRNSGGSRGFSHLRGQMEAEDVIPAMGGDFEFACQACYQDGGDVDAVRFTWTREVPSWGVEREYRELIVNVSSLDCTSVLDGGYFVDAYGFETTWNAIITERDGIDITCAGAEDSCKLIRFYDGETWYQIYGDPGITFEEMVRVLDFFFEHPMNVERFEYRAGGQLHTSSLEYHPEAFSGLYPTEELTGRCPPMNGVPELDMLDDYAYGISCIYERDVDGTAVERWEAYDMRYECYQDVDWDRMHSIGDLDGLTEEDVEAYMEDAGPYQYRLAFSWGEGYRVAVKVKFGATARELWELLCAVRGAMEEMPSQ